MNLLRLPDWLLGRKRTSRADPVGWDLSMLLLTWSCDNAWTLASALEGTLVTGATGSGKSSGPGRRLGVSFLRAGFGGLVLTAKSDERAAWEEYMRESGRAEDLRVVGADATLRLNFLDYELNRKGEGAGLTENLVNLFSTCLEIASRGTSGGDGREDSSYWRQATRQHIRNCVELLALAKGRISVPDLYRVAISAPTSRDLLRSEEWKSRSLCFSCLVEADKRNKTPRQAADFEIVADYFTVLWPTLAEKTRSVITSTFTAMADVLNRGLLRDLFCTDTNITPEATTEGKVILLDLPVKEFGEVGQLAQVLWKYVFQRSIERRDVAGNPRPVFLWADEAQHFLTSYDMQFQTTCRSSRVATVYLTQNVSNVYAALGGQEKGRAEAASLFANLNTKILLANGDPVTNDWAASLIGRSRQFLASGNSSRSNEEGWELGFGLNGLGQPTNTSAGFSETFEFEVQPAAFTQLRTGGPSNQWEIDSIVFQNGRRFDATGKTWLPVTFGQKQKGMRRR